MIAELVQQAKRLVLTGREPYKQRAIHWLIELDSEGNVLGLTPTTQYTTGKQELKEVRGKHFDIPANYLLGSPNQHNWRPDFLTGPANEIFPGGVDGNNPVAAKQEKWRALVASAQEIFPDNFILRAVLGCLEKHQSLVSIPLPVAISGDLDCFRKQGTSEGETLAFRVEGALAHQNHELRRWWENTYHPDIRNAVTGGIDNRGCDAFQMGDGPLAKSSPCVFGNVPFTSFNCAPFKSFGLGDETLRIRLDTAEQSVAALNALQNNPSHKLNLGDQIAIYWATFNDQSVDCSFVSLLEAPDPLAVGDFMKSVWGGIPKELAQALFQVAILEPGTGRFAVRSWNSCFLGDLARSYRAYFEAIRMLDGIPINLGSLASVTIAKSKKGSKTKPASTTYNAIFETAWRSSQLPGRILESVITRQALEFAKGKSDNDKGEFAFRLRARTALIKLYFYSNQKELKDKPMNENHHENQDHPAYLCGRVLALLDKIHNAAHGKSTASSPAGRYYGSASSTPALVFPRLCKLARIHLEKVDNRGWAYNLDKSLAALVSKFNEIAKWPRILSLEDQGRFAIGFYYERNLRFAGENEATDADTVIPDQPESDSENSSQQSN